MRSMEKLVNGNIEVTIDIHLKYDGHKTVIIQPDSKPAEFDPEKMSPLQKALVQGFQYRDALENGDVATVSELARRENQERAFLFRALSILNGTEPPTVTLSQLRRGFPDDWDEQRKVFGMA